MNVYLDTNIFDRLEKIDSLEEIEKENYQKLYDAIVSGKISVPYSNAHLNDLYRGYLKNPSYIEKHLSTLDAFTKDLCICQYWGDKEALWHRRNVRDFFENKKSDLEDEAQTWSDLIKDYPHMQLTMELKKRIPLPPQMKKGFKDPMFAAIYPLAKIYNTEAALVEDIFNLNNKLKSDYGFYKSLKSYLIQNAKTNADLLKSIPKETKDVPLHLKLFDQASELLKDNYIGENQQYSRVINTFIRQDFDGFKTDAQYNNMFDDAMHTFYASHCDYFITNDDKCNYKAQKTFEQLNIKTQVLKINEIANINCW